MFIVYRDNINTGYGVDFATNRSLSIQTPAVDFVILNQTVSSLSASIHNNV